MKTFFLSLTGGEPFLRDDLNEIATAFFENSQTEVLGLQTGAQFPERIEHTLTYLHNTHPDKRVILKLSLDALGEKHDAIRKTPGNFRAFEQTVRHCKDLMTRWSNLNLKVVTTVNRHNIDEIENIAEYVQDHVGPNFHSVKPLHGRPRHPELKEERDEYHQVKHLLAQGTHSNRSAPNRLYRLFQKSAQKEIDRHYAQGEWRGECKAGSKFIIIRENGDVLPCEIKDVALGNLHECGYSLANVLRETPVDIRRNALNCSCDWECGPTFSLPYQKNILKLIRK